MAAARARAFENPFVYGEVVPASAFVGREAELDRLVRDLVSGQKVFLVSPRRYGKSSLIRRAAERIARDGVLTVELTVSSYSSYLAFLEGFARAVVAQTGPVEGWARRLREWLRGVRTDVRAAPDASRGSGAADLAFPGIRSARDEARLAADVFALPQRVADLRGRPVVVALDEFQDVAQFDGGSVEQALRAAVQHQRDVGYVFAGSEPTLMEQMVSPRRPFYKAGPVMRLERLPADVFAAFVERQFATHGRPVVAGLGEAIVDLAGNLPYDVQRLAHELWDDTGGLARPLGLEDLHRTLGRLLGEQRLLFEGLWQRLTLLQRATLRAVVFEEGHELLSAATRERYRLGGPSSVQSALGALTRHEIIQRDEGAYVVVDSLFREWVARTTY